MLARDCSGNGFNCHKVYEPADDGSGDDLISIDHGTAHHLLGDDPAYVDNHGATR